MEYRRLGRSGLKVSEIGLGTSSSTVVSWAGEQEARAILDRALELGVNFIDTAPTYDHGRAEDLIGKALKGKRAQVMIGSKFGHPGHLGPEDSRGGSRYHIMKAVEGSLKRLHTDYIDLYSMHFPDPETPVEETLRTLDDLVSAGKIRYIGCCNFPAWRLCEALWASKAGNFVSFITVQNAYNMLNRAIEPELVPCCEAYGISVVPHGPLAGGFLTGKYRRGQAMPTGARLTSMPAMAKRFLSEAGLDKLDKLESFARERGHSVGELAVAWLLARPWLGSIIAGATRAEQLSLNVAAATWKLTSDDLAQLDKVL